MIHFSFLCYPLNPQPTTPYLSASTASVKTRCASQVPIYSFKESKRVGYRDQEVPKSRIVLIEGIYALSNKIR